MITAIIQARLSSTRLPLKVLKQFSGNTLLGHIVERLTYAKSISRIIVATTDNPIDDELVDWLHKQSLEVFRGSESDVLGRYYAAATACNASHIARVTSDDPFKDPEIIDRVAELYLRESLDFAYNNNPPTFAEGLDTEIFSYQALRTANYYSKDPFEREHVTQHFYRNPDFFKQENLTSAEDFSDLRWTLDTEEDFAMAKTVYEHLYKKGKIFLADDIRKLIEQKPEIAEINRNVKRSDMYNK